MQQLEVKFQWVKYVTDVLVLDILLESRLPGMVSGKEMCVSRALDEHIAFDHDDITLFICCYCYSGNQISLIDHEI